MKDIFHCTNCGSAEDVEKLQYTLEEEAKFTCPTCGSVFSITALMTEPGNKPAEPGVESQPLPEPEAGEPSEAPASEAPAPEAAPGESAAPSEAPGQIPAAESVQVRVQRAIKDAREGKDAQQIFSALLRPMKLYTPKVVLRTGSLLREGKLSERVLIDLTPSPSEYRHCLKLLMASASDPSTRSWARAEYNRVKNVLSWKSAEQPALPQGPGTSRDWRESKQLKVTRLYLLLEVDIKPILLMQELLILQQIIAHR